MQTLRNIKNQPPLSPAILTFLIHFPQLQLLYIFLINHSIPFYDKIIDFFRFDSELILQILVIGQLVFRTFLVGVLSLRQFVLRDKKSSVEIMVLKFLKVKIKILITISLYWNMRACKILDSHYFGIAVFNILFTILQILGTRILNSSFRFEEENLICQKNQSLIQSLMMFPIAYLLNFYDLFYAACLIFIRCLVQLYQNFKNVQNKAIQYCDYFSPLVMMGFCVIEGIGHLTVWQILTSSNVLFFVLILGFTIYGANCLTDTLLVLVPKYHLKKCTYFIKNEGKPSLLEIEGTLNLPEEQVEQFIVALRVLAKVYIAKMKMQGLFSVKENPYHGSLVSQDEFNLLWTEFNKILINHRVYCTLVTCPCLKRSKNRRQSSQISNSLFIQIMFSSLQKVMNSSSSTKLAIVEKYFYIELLQKPIKNYYLLVKLRKIVRRSQQILEVDLLMDQTREMLGHLLTKGKAMNQHININELIGFQEIINSLKKGFIEISANYAEFYDIFHNAFVQLPLLKKCTKNLINNKTTLRQRIQQLSNKFSRNVQFLTFALVYYTYFDQYTENANKLKSKIHLLNKYRLSDSSLSTRSKTNRVQNRIDVFSCSFGAIKIDLVEKPGEVISATRNICHLLGYKMSEVEGESVNKLMPHIFGRYHNQYLKSFVQKGSISMIRQKEKRFFARNQKKFISPITVRIKVQYMCSQNFCANSLIKRTPTKSEFVLMNNYGKIEEISQNLYKLLFQRSLRDDIARMKKLNMFKMLLSLNHFVKNPLDMEDRVWQGVLMTVDDQELIHMYYKTIDLHSGRHLGGHSAQKGLKDLTKQAERKPKSSVISIGDRSSTILDKTVTGTGFNFEGQDKSNDDKSVGNASYDASKCCLEMKQGIRDLYRKINLGKLRAYKIAYKFYDLVTSEFTCKVLEIVSIREELNEDSIRYEVSRELADIGELYGLPEDEIKKFQCKQSDGSTAKSLRKFLSTIINGSERSGDFLLLEDDGCKETVASNQRIEPQVTTKKDSTQKPVSGGSSVASYSEHNLKKSSLITSFNIPTSINKKLQNLLTVLMLLSSSFLIMICIFSTTLEPDYKVLQNDNSIINQLKANFESRIVIEEMEHFYHSLDVEKPSFIQSQQDILAKTIKQQLINSYKWISSDLSGSMFETPMTLNHIDKSFTQQRPILSALNEIYAQFLMNEKNNNHISDNYQQVRSKMEQIMNLQKYKIITESQSFKVKIHAVVAIYAFILVAIVAVLIKINNQSSDKQQKIIDFLPFVNKRQIKWKMNFYQDLLQHLKENQELKANQIQNVQGKSLQDNSYVKTQSKKRVKTRKNLAKDNAQKQRISQALSSESYKKMNSPDTRLIRIVKGSSKTITVKNGLFMFMMTFICVAVIVCTEYFFSQAHNKFISYLNINQSTMTLQSLGPQTLLTYLINVDKIIHSQQTITLPQSYYDAPGNDIFGLNLYLAKQDVNGTEMAVKISQKINRQICDLVSCEPADIIPRETNFYFLTYHFINSLEYLRKTWSILQYSPTPKQDIKRWIEEENLLQLFNSVKYILELSRSNQQEISTLLTGQINLIGYQLLFFSITLIPILIFCMYVLNKRFIKFVYERVQSIQDTYKQFSWQILSENSYAVNHFENKMRMAKEY